MFGLCFSRKKMEILLFPPKEKTILSQMVFKLGKSIREIQEAQKFKMPSRICSYVEYKKYKRERGRHTPQWFSSRKI